MDSMDKTEIQHDTVINKIKEILEEEFTATEIVRVYTDFVPEHFLRPSFSVLEISLPTEDGMITDTHEIIDKTYMFDIMYYPKDSDNTYTEYRYIEQKLMEHLKSLKLSDSYITYRDKNVNSFVQDKIGHFIVSFPVRLVMRDSTSLPIITSARFSTHISK